MPENKVNGYVYSTFPYLHLFSVFFQYHSTQDYILEWNIITKSPLLADSESLETQSRQATLVRVCIEPWGQAKDSAEWRLEVSLPP